MTPSGSDPNQALYRLSELSTGAIQPQQEAQQPHPGLLSYMSPNQPPVLRYAYGHGQTPLSQLHGSTQPYDLSKLQGVMQLDPQLQTLGLRDLLHDPLLSMQQASPVPVSGVPQPLIANPSLLNTGPGPGTGGAAAAPATSAAAPKCSIIELASSTRPRQVTSEKCPSPARFRSQAPLSVGPKAFNKSSAQLQASITSPRRQQPNSVGPTQRLKSVAPRPRSVGPRTSTWKPDPQSIENSSLLYRPRGELLQAYSKLGDSSQTEPMAKSKNLSKQLPTKTKKTTRARQQQSKSTDGSQVTNAKPTRKKTTRSR